MATPPRKRIPLAASAVNIALRLGSGLACLAASFPIPALAAQDHQLASLSLEQLMNIEVSSVSKKDENRSEAPAAISVITGEDIRRLGATSIPEALKLATGLHVGRVSSNEWAVSSRGFSGLNSAKLLVLIDGRSVYTPLFSGVFWDVQDTLLEDIDRIEVIRGPGASIWGANAMNGVINILTKSSRQTQGAYAEAGGGTHDRVFGAARFGGSALGESLTYRVYGKFFDRDAGFRPTLGTDSDDWRMGRVGARSDWKLTSDDTLFFSGDIYGGNIGQAGPSVVINGRPGPPSPLRTLVNGGHALAGWKRSLGEKSDIQLRFYYDRTHRDDPSYTDDLDIYDLEFQNRFALPLGQEIMWGGGFRLMVNENRGKGIFDLSSPRSSDRLYSGFVQDQVSLLDRSLRFALGSKFEHNDFSGFEAQPTGRFAWDPVHGHTLWAAVSRAVRVQTRLERDVSIAAADPASDPLPVLLGNRELDSEELWSYELGYRLPVSRVFYLDLATFYNRYSDLMTLEIGDPFADPAGKTIVPVVNRNQMKGVARGAELAGAFEPSTGSWKLTASYSYFNLKLTPQGADLNRGSYFEGATPAHQFALGAYVPLPHGLELNSFFRWIGRLRSTADLGNSGLSPYATLDARLGWRLKESLELSVVGQNLIQARHVEFPGNGTEIERAAYAKLAARF
jgi:iron complex outermembrane receptor protein